MKYIRVLLNIFSWKIQKIVRRKKTQSGIWVFGEWFGEKCCDNCLFFANYLAKNVPNIKLYWIAKDNVDLHLLDDRITLLAMDSKEAMVILRKADAVIVNQCALDISSRLSYRVHAPIFINLWHGVPWKKIGIDRIKDGSPIRLKYEKYSCRTKGPDLFLTTSRDFTKVLKTSYEINPSHVIKSGYPRNSVFYSSDLINRCRLNVIDVIPVSIPRSNLKIIVYMPTFRDTKEQCFSFMKMEGLQELLSYMMNNNIVILQKSHFAECGNPFDAETNRIITMNDIPAYKLLASADLLITDYSSCFFDYLLLDRPIIHFLYDFDYYSNDDRGLYYSVDDVACGDVVQNEDELFEAIKSNMCNPSKYAELRKIKKERFLEYESSTSCEDIYKFIIEWMHKNN